MSDSYQRQEDRHPRPGSVQVTRSFRPSFPAGKTSSLLFLLRGFDKDERPSGKLEELHNLTAPAPHHSGRMEMGQTLRVQSDPLHAKSTLPLTDLGKLFIPVVLPFLHL